MSAVLQAPARGPVAPAAPGALPDTWCQTQEIVLLIFSIFPFLFFFNITFLPSCDAPRMSPLQL